jgi:hypothetical protein
MAGESGSLTGANRRLPRHCQCSMAEMGGLRLGILVPRSAYERGAFPPQPLSVLFTA